MVEKKNNMYYLNKDKKNDLSKRKITLYTAGASISSFLIFFVTESVFYDLVSIWYFIELNDY